MKYKFVSFGGNGSSYLVSSLRSRFQVGDKPDAVFQAVFQDLYRIMHIEGDLYQWFAREAFQWRAGLTYETSATTSEDILAEYLSRAERLENHVAVFNTAFEFEFFSKRRVRDVVFQLRHPLHGYLSFAKPERHGALLDYLGGRDGRRAASFYATRWRQAAEEYLRLKDQHLGAKLLRYEYMHEDLAAVPELRWVYRGFDADRRNYNDLPAAVEETIAKVVSGCFGSIYPSWEV